MIKPYDSVPETLSDETLHRRRLATALNLLLVGKMNVSTDLVLRVAATETPIIDARISLQSVLLFTPMSGSAAAELGSLFVASQASGSAVVQHSSSSALDRKFRLVILG
ncbi:MAG: hypothetical protein ORO03_06840 [Alphaproteobacteria bacterium]|nr:hypothetical protein [Alphaproteobacteria bacterium]